jgi:hypothetical protein
MIKEFSFSLISLNSIFSTLPQSEYTSRLAWDEVEGKYGSKEDNQANMEMPMH